MPIEDVRQAIVRALADDAIAVKARGDAILGPVREVADGICPGVAVVPTMSTDRRPIPQCRWRSYLWHFGHVMTETIGRWPDRWRRAQTVLLKRSRR